MAGALPVIDGPEAFAAAFDVSRETVDRLRTYESLLRHWQKAVNLVAPATLDAVWHRHFADSAQLLACGEEARSWLDLGAGAGLPGLVIAILLANRGDVSVHLVESKARKCAFLADVARETGITVDIYEARIESLVGDARVTGPDIVTARAPAPLPDLLALAAPFFEPHTKGLFLKGKGVETELAAAEARFAFAATLHPSRTDPSGRVVEIRDLRERGRR